MSVKGNKCGFCDKTVGHPCWFSGEAARCHRNKPVVITDASQAEDLLRRAATPPEPLDVQIGGDHYKRMKIQPIVYIEANKLGFVEGSVVKYVSRWENKNGIEDLKKARDLLTKKIAMMEKEARGADQNKAG